MKNLNDKSTKAYKKYPSLGHTLVLWFLLLSLLPLMLLSWIGYQNTTASLKTAAAESVQQSLMLSAGYIESWFDYRLLFLDSHAKSKGNLQLLISLAEGFSKSGKKLSDYVNSDDWRLRTRNQQVDLVSLKHQYEYIYDLFLIDTEGNIIYSVAHEDDLGTNLFTGRYSDTLFAKSVKKVRQTGRRVFSDLERYGPSGNIVSGFISTALLDDSGKQAGFIAIQIRLAGFISTLKKHLKSHSTLTHYLVGEDGKLRSPVRDDEKEVLRRVINTEQLKLWKEEHGEQGKEHYDQIEKHFQYTGADNKKVIGIHQMLRLPDVSWALISEIDEDEALESSALFAKITTAVLLLTFFIVIALSVYQARRISKPIMLLAEATEDFAAGETVQRVEVKSANEIARLVDSFNKMMEMRQRYEADVKSSRDESNQALAELAEQKYALDQHAIVAITDIGGTITFVNYKFTEISGYSSEELIGQNHRMLNSGHHSKEFFQRMYHTISNGLVWNGEICNRAKNGRLYWVDTTIVPFMDDNNKPKSYVAIRTDITERKLAETELAEQKYALDQHAIVAITDVQGTITFVNDKFTEISGYSSEELIGKNHRMLNSGFHEKEFFHQMYHTISRGKVWHAEICNKAKSGRLYWVDTTIVPFMHANGKPKSYVAIRADITERKKAEAQLYEAKELAEAAVTAKGEFLASMSHEIRTPMNGILGMLSLLQNTELDEVQKHRVLVAQNSAKSLLKLINDILDFSKVDAGKLEIEKIDFDLRDMMGDMAEALSYGAQAKGLELVLDVSAINDTKVNGDPGRVRQILTNLVSNAIKFTDEGEVIIRASIQAEKENILRFECSVCDTGIGIELDKQAHLFESFSQVDASTTRKYGGTGLGLSIAKKLSELMDGDLKMESEVGKGSCFSTRLYFQKSKLLQQVLPEIDISAMTILVVDDNATNRQVLRTQFECWGANVEEASSGLEALELCAARANEKEHPFYDIAFIDMQMPAMDGEELGKKIKADKRFQSLKLVMMTPMGFQGETSYVSDHGFSACFPKPATTSDLFDALTVVTENSDHMNVEQYMTEKNEEQSEASADDNDWPENTRVLLVEDNQVNQIVALSTLEALGVSADVAGNGIEALQALKAAPLDAPYTLVFMDCQMPEMDGFEASRRIRAGDAGGANTKIPIVALTANAMKEDEKKCLAAGMSDYLSKPFEEIQLKDKLLKWLTVDTNNQR
ncbi:MAG: PAS domain S-box protein [Gammaproteobacteria bacterium]|nr:PAS domain S-box protein [Gammaproteobacteria bacterium]